MMRSKCLRAVLGMGLFAGLGCALGHTQEPEPTRLVPYKTIEDVELQLHIFEPTGHTPEDSRPGVVFFFGGGWNSGAPSQFYPQCAHLAARGMWAASAEYRVKKRHGTTPRECVADGRSALRFVRAHAKELGVDPKRLAAGGGSAGGHVAAATATITAFDEREEDPKLSAVPNALLLFNPVYDNGPEGYGHDRVSKYWREISPAHHIAKGMPPAIVFLGTEDKLIPVATARRFQAAMKEVGSRSELVLFEGQGHGFFNRGRGDGTGYTESVAAMDRFLVSLEWLAKPIEEEKSGSAADDLPVPSDKKR